MSTTRTLAHGFVLFVFAVAALGQSAAAEAQSQPPAGQVTPDPWPRTISLQGAKYSLYQPQVDSWNGGDLQAHAAVSVLAAAPASQVPVFGVIEITAKTEVDRTARTVYFRQITVVKATFPSAPQRPRSTSRASRRWLTTGRSTMSLDRLEAMLAIEGAEKKARSIPVKNDPPTIVFSQTQRDPRARSTASRSGAPCRAPGSSAS